MKSLDTNIFIYAANANCSEHESAVAILSRALDEPSEWVIADQVMYEYLRALSNKLIFSRPISKDKATSAVRQFRQESGFRFCGCESEIFERVLSQHSKSSRDRLYDIILAESLKYNGVSHFYTRNTRDFSGLGFEKVINPID